MRFIGIYSQSRTPCGKLVRTQGLSEQKNTRERGGKQEYSPATKENNSFAEARKIARRADSWIAFANALCDPNGGLIARYFPDPDQQQEFLRSPD